MIVVDFAKLVDDARKHVTSWLHALSNWLFTIIFPTRNILLMTRNYGVIGVLRTQVFLPWALRILQQNQSGVWP